MDYNNAVYISAQSSKRIESANILADYRLEARLGAGLYRFERASGVYKGIEEPCYIVATDSEYGPRVMYGDLLELATEFLQESILIVRNSLATLQFTADGRCEPIGSIVHLSAVANASDFQGDHTKLKDGSILLLEHDAVTLPAPSRKAA